VGRILICILGIAGSACAEKTFDYIKHGSPLGCLHPIQNRGTSSPDALPVFTGERAGAHRFRILICGLLVIVNCEKIKPYLTTFSPVLPHRNTDFHKAVTDVPCRFPLTPVDCCGRVCNKVCFSGFFSTARPGGPTVKIFQAKQDPRRLDRNCL